jgi:hypothetical protein
MDLAGDDLLSRSGLAEQQCGPAAATEFLNHP